MFLIASPAKVQVPGLLPAKDDPDEPLLCGECLYVKKGNDTHSWWFLMPVSVCWDALLNKQITLEQKVEVKEGDWFWLLKFEIEE